MLKNSRRTNYIAIDLGATSGRIMLDENSRITEIYRFSTPMIKNENGIFWDIGKIFCGVLTGLQKLSEVAETVVSVSCDSWAQDFGMLDEDGRLICDPFSYRDKGSAIFTAARLAYIEEKFPERFARAVQILHIADLIHHLLCGKARSNYTLAANSRLPLDHKLLSPLADCEIIGEINHPSLPGFAGIPVISGAGHDTAAAFEGGNIQEGDLFISLGTWLMAAELWENGREIPENFSALPLTRKKLARTTGGMGMWPFQQCVKLWQAREDFPGYRVLDDQAAALDIHETVDPDTPSLYSPENMENAIFELIGRKASPAELTSMLLRGSARKIAERSALFKRKFNKVVIVGGGIGGQYMRSLLEKELVHPVCFGNTEASAAGNAAIQKTVMKQFL